MWQFIALEVKDKDGHKGVYASIDFPVGEEIFYLQGPLVSEPTRTSIKIADGKHVEDKFGGFINHNCNPSTEIRDGKVIAIKNIKRGDEITFDYTSNEDALTNPFTCLCCGKYIE